jgi:Na+-transporting NADH:ubiquinone oxidoreductase subunit NqrD
MGYSLMAFVVCNRFYAQIAVVPTLFIVVGFLRTYYLRFLSDLPPLVKLVQLHGIVFTGWLVLFVVQTQLIAAHRVDLHRRLSILGAVLAVCIVVLGVATAFHTATVPRVRVDS